MKLAPTSVLVAVWATLFVGTHARIRGSQSVHGTVALNPDSLSLLNDPSRLLKAQSSMKIPADMVNAKDENKSQKHGKKKKEPKSKKKEEASADSAEEPENMEAAIISTNETAADVRAGRKESEHLEAMKSVESDEVLKEEDFDSSTANRISSGVRSVEDPTETEIEYEPTPFARRTLTLFAVEYTTASNQIPGSLDYIELARVTRHLLSNMFHWYYGNFANIHYELLEMHRYTVLGPRLLKFDISLHFQDSEGFFVPTQGDIQSVVQDQLYEDSDYGKLYLNRLQNSAFGIFTSTSSFRVIGNADELRDVRDEINENTEATGFEDFGPAPWLNLVVFLAFVFLSILICVALCVCCRRRRRRIRQRREHETAMGGRKDATCNDYESTNDPSDYRTTAFSEVNEPSSSLPAIPPKTVQDTVAEGTQDAEGELEEIALEETPPVVTSSSPLKETVCKALPVWAAQRASLRKVPKDTVEVEEPGDNADATKSMVCKETVSGLQEGAILSPRVTDPSTGTMGALVASKEGSSIKANLKKDGSSQLSKEKAPSDEAESLVSSKPSISSSSPSNREEGKAVVSVSAKASQWTNVSDSKMPVWASKSFLKPVDRSHLNEKKVVSTGDKNKESVTDSTRGSKDESRKKTCLNDTSANTCTTPLTTTNSEVKKTSPVVQEEGLPGKPSTQDLILEVALEPSQVNSPKVETKVVGFATESDTHTVEDSGKEPLKVSPAERTQVEREQKGVSEKEKSPSSPEETSQPEWMLKFKQMGLERK